MTTRGSERRPIDEIVVKVAARCNIDCDYCYEFNRGDTSWRRLPRVMAPATMEMLAARVRQHALAHQLPTFNISLHGGEPTLLGADGLSRLAATLRRAAAGAFDLVLSLQTNGILLDERLVDVIREYDIGVGVSLDGDRMANDRHRVSHLGVSTFDATMRGVRLLRARAPDQLLGVIVVIDLANDPAEVLDFVGGLGVSFVDFLLPLHSWDRPPARTTDERHEYADWYFRAYEAWISGRHPHLRIRFLENLLRNLCGASGSYEQNTIDPVSLIVVNTAGEYEGLDALKSALPGSQVLNMNVREHSLEDVLGHWLVALRQAGGDAAPTGRRDRSSCSSRAQSVAQVTTIWS
jgi:uncharacterized protein